jgi:hypothetical protein
MGQVSNLDSSPKAWNPQLIYREALVIPQLIAARPDVHATASHPLRQACSETVTEFRSRKTQAARMTQTLLTYNLAIQYV